MKKALTTIICSIIVNAVSADEKIPNFVGDWVVKSEAAVYGAGGFHPADVYNSPFRVHNFEIHFLVDEQQGRSFHGRLVSGKTSQNLVGSIAQDGKSGVMASEGGVFQFMMKSKNSLVYCFAQTQPNLLVAACNSAERK